MSKQKYSQKSFEKKSRENTNKIIDFQQSLNENDPNGDKTNNRSSKLHNRHHSMRENTNNHFDTISEYTLIFLFKILIILAGAYLLINLESSI